MKPPFSIETLEQARIFFRDMGSLLSPKNLCILWVVSKHPAITIRDLKHKVESIDGIKETTYRNFSRDVVILIEIGLLKGEMNKPKTPLKLFIDEKIYEQGGIGQKGLIIALQKSWEDYLVEISKIVKQINSNNKKI